MTPPPSEGVTRWKYLVLVGVVLLAGCEVKPISQAPSDNAEVHVGLIVTIEGCRVYRFRDDGKFRYVTICGDKRTAQTSWDDIRSTGKVAVAVPSAIDTVVLP